MSFEREAEMKLKMSLPDLERVLAAFVEKENPAIKHKFNHREYYDTDALDLYHAKVGLRMQYKKGKNGVPGFHEQTVKYLLPDDSAIEGLSVRGECKDKLPTSSPDVSSLSDEGARAVVEPFLGKKLKHIFTAAVERRYFNVTVGAGKDKGTVELAFDVGEIILPAIGKRIPFAEVEIEMKKGSTAAIEAVCAAIQKIAPDAEIKTDESKAKAGTDAYRKYVLKQN
ncbi:MAG: CYTH domain-containing protein [Alphaproteobacteria bacterium]|nr:CYTH domain-containing protein [Alphaproteobacteria bacterium]